MQKLDRSKTRAQNGRGFSDVEVSNQRNGRYIGEYFDSSPALKQPMLSSQFSQWSRRALTPFVGIYGELSSVCWFEWWTLMPMRQCSECRHEGATPMCCLHDFSGSISFLSYVGNLNFQNSSLRFLKISESIPLPKKQSIFLSVRWRSWHCVLRECCSDWKCLGSAKSYGTGKNFWSSIFPCQLTSWGG